MGIEKNNGKGAVMVASKEQTAIWAKAMIEACETGEIEQPELVSKILERMGYYPEKKFEPHWSSEK
jgi:hypothetical protein